MSEHIKRLGVLLVAALIVVSGIGAAATINTHASWTTQTEFESGTTTGDTTITNGYVTVTNGSWESPQDDIGYTINRVDISELNSSIEGNITIELLQNGEVQDSTVINSDDRMYDTVEADFNEIMADAVRVKAPSAAESIEFGSIELQAVNEAPTASLANAETTTELNSSINLNANASSDPDNNVLTYEWDVDGDGVYDYEQFDNGDLTHTYEATGTYEVTLRVTDSQNQTATDNITVEVTDAANETYDVSVDVVDDSGEAVANASVNLTDVNESATTDENGSATIADIAEGTHNVTVTGPDGDLSVDDEIEVTENDTEFEVVLSESNGGGGGAVIDTGDTTTLALVGGGLLLVFILFAALAGADP